MNAPMSAAKLSTHRALPEALLTALRAHFGERCSTAAAVC